jgi:drug/metabolite transporter (DMT)-like permease
VTLMVVFSTVLPFLLLFEGIRLIGADKASLITLLGPAVTLLAAWLILDERLVLLQWSGFALVLAGMAVLQFGERLWRHPIREGAREPANRQSD